jgi:DNA-binding protein HU-beta
MNKTLLIKKIAEENDLTVGNVKFVVDVFLETLKKETLKSGKIILPEFGIFKSYERPERIGRNPQNQKAVKIPQKTIIKFKESK